jgi:hypothetical protein
MTYPSKFMPNFVKLLKFIPKYRHLYFFILLWIAFPVSLFGQNLIPDTAQTITPSGDSSTIIDDTTQVRVSPKKNLAEIIEFEATDSMILTFSEKKVHLYHKAKIVSPKTNLESYYIEIALHNKELFAKGTLDSNGVYGSKPILSDEGEQYTADSMHYNSQTKKGRVYGLKLAQQDAFIHLGKVLKQPDGNFTGVQGKITTCDADHPHFFLNTRKVKVMPNNKALFGAANLVFMDIPTPIALPFGLAPLKKGQRNGILFPSIGFNGFNRTLYLQNFGYYLGLGERADMQINTDAYVNGDFRLGVQTQYLRRYVFQGNLGFQFSRFSNGAEITSPQFSRTRDFAIRSQFNLDPKYMPGVRFGGNINVVTSGFNQRNSRDLNSLSNNQFTSSINYGQSFFKNKVNLSMAARHTQNTQTRDFRLELPSVNIGVSSLTPFASKTGSNQKWYQQLRLSYSGNMANFIQTKDSILFSERFQEALQGFKSGLTHAIPLSTNIKLFNGILNISPNLNYNENWHFTGQILEADPNTNAVVKKDTQGFFRQYAYSLSVSAKTNIYGTLTGLKWGRIEALRHTITPTFALSYAPEIDALSKGWSRNYTDTSGRLINYNFFGNSAVGSISQRQSANISYGINNNFQGKRRISADSGNKTEKFNIIDQLNLSGNYNAFADSLKFSDVRLNFNTVLFKIIRINAQSSYSLYQRTERGNLINTFMWEDGGFMRLRSAGININSGFNAETFKKKKIETKPKKEFEEERAELNDVLGNMTQYYDFNIPWTLNVTYMANYNAETPLASQRVSTNRIRINGDISLTEQWKISYETGYDFKSQQLEGSRFAVVRNLHCWQLEFSWIPTGFGRQWLFTLRPVSRLLQDLRLNRRVYSNPALM